MSISLATAESARDQLAQSGYVLLEPGELEAVLQVSSDRLEPLRRWWSDLPRDQYLRDGGHYRARRHACFTETFDSAGAEHSTLTLVPHRPHWQPTAYNALHGGLERWFEPIAPELVRSALWQQLLTSIGTLFAQLRPVARWYIEAHQFRIDTTGGIGRPTPEGAHRDGVDFVALLLIGRRNVRGGETRVFDANGPSGVRFTMQDPWSLLLMDDARVIHETTPIQAGDEHGELAMGAAVRDTLVLTYRERGFQAPGAD